MPPETAPSTVPASPTPAVATTTAPDGNSSGLATSTSAASVAATTDSSAAAAAPSSTATPQPATPSTAAPAAPAAPAKSDSAAAPQIDGAKAAGTTPGADGGKAPSSPPSTPESTPSLLEAAAGKPKPTEAKPDGKAADATKAAPDATPTPADATKAAPDVTKAADAAKAPDSAKDATAAAQPPAPVKYEAFKVPDGVKLDDKEVAKFTEIVGTRQLPQEDAQKLVDLYLEDRKRLENDLRVEQRKVWDRQIDTWKSNLRKDPVLGGNRLETSLSMAKAVVEEFGGTAEQQAELWRHINEGTGNGMGNYVGLVRLLHNIAVFANVFEDSSVPANPKAPAMPKGKPGSGQTGWYKESMGNGAATAP